MVKAKGWWRTIKKSAMRSTFRRWSGSVRTGWRGLSDRIQRDRVGGRVLRDIKMLGQWQRRQEWVRATGSVVRAWWHKGGVSSTGVKGVGLGGLVLALTALCIGVKGWGPDNGLSSPPQAIARGLGEGAAPSGTRPNGSRTAPIMGASREAVAWSRIVPHNGAVPSQAAGERQIGELTRLKMDYAATRERCLTRLYNSPQYLAARARADQLEMKVRALRSGDPAGELMSLSPRWIEAKSDLNHMAQAALESDPQVQRAAATLKANGLTP